MSRRRDPRREAALAAGERFYAGPPCRICGGVQRYAHGGACVACSRSKKRTGGMSAGRLEDRPSAAAMAAAIAARDARLAYVETLGMRFLGDPPPGRSALDRRMAAAAGMRTPPPPIPGKPESGKASP